MDFLFLLVFRGAVGGDYQQNFLEWSRWRFNEWQQKLAEEGKGMWCRTWVGGEVKGKENWWAEIEKKRQGMRMGASEEIGRLGTAEEGRTWQAEGVWLFNAKTLNLCCFPLKWEIGAGWFDDPPEETAFQLTVGEDGILPWRRPSRHRFTFREHTPLLICSVQSRWRYMQHKS